MLWYGRMNYDYVDSMYKSNFHKRNYKLRRVAFFYPLFKNISLSFQTLYIPRAWSFLLLTHNIKKSHQLLYLYSDLYFFKLLIYKNLRVLYHDPIASIIHLKMIYVYSYFSTYFKIISSLFYSFTRVFFVKLKFKGKGYYIYKNKRNTITPQFGHAHRIYVYTYYTSVKFLSKTSVFVFGLSKQDVLKAGVSIKALKPINIFTGRGVRFNREIIYRKVGKVSSYR